MTGKLDELEKASRQTDEYISALGYLFPLLLANTVIKSWNCFQEILSQYQVRDLLHCDPSAYRGVAKIPKYQSENSVLDHSGPPSHPPKLKRSQ